MAAGLQLNIFSQTPGAQNPEISTPKAGQSPTLSNLDILQLSAAAV